MQNFQPFRVFSNGYIYNHCLLAWLRAPGEDFTFYCRCAWHHGSQSHRESHQATCVSNLSADFEPQ